MSNKYHLLLKLSQYKIKPGIADVVFDKSVYAVTNIHNLLKAYSENLWIELAMFLPKAEFVYFDL